MKLHFFGIFLLFIVHGSSKSEVDINYRVTLAVPVEYTIGFVGRAYLMESDDQVVPYFRVALAAEAINGKYACSIQVFLGEVRVWSSGHYSKFYMSEICVLELTVDGDLQVKGPKEEIGWRTGTSGQGVERMQILKTGNLILVDTLDKIKWQSFNFPTNVMVYGQRLDVATQLTSFPSNNSSLFYSFEIREDKIGLYVNAGKLKYSYWEFMPSKNRNITFLQLGPKGLVLFNDKNRKIAQIPVKKSQVPRFLALNNQTGNMGLYYYSTNQAKFEASFQALNTTCDLPLACKPYGICTFSNSCSCIRVVEEMSSGCSEGTSGGFCGHDGVEMVELGGVTSVLKGATGKFNISKDDCTNLCLKDCNCTAALYSSGKGNSNVQECSLYGLAIGVKQVDRGSGFTYMVKVPKGARYTHGKSNLKTWIVVLIGLADGLVILLVVGGFLYYLIRRRRKRLARNSNS